MVALTTPNDPPTAQVPTARLVESACRRWDFELVKNWRADQY